MIHANDDAFHVSVLCLLMASATIKKNTAVTTAKEVGNDIQGH